MSESCLPILPDFYQFNVADGSLYFVSHFLKGDSLSMSTLSCISPNQSGQAYKLADDTSLSQKLSESVVFYQFSWSVKDNITRLVF